MMNHELAHLAIRSRLASVVVVTTGSVTLSATATGYARTTGSFVTDGFAVGMEVTPTGFTQTTVGVVTKVEALALEIAGGRSVESAGAGRSLTTKLPTKRGWENVTLTPIAGQPYVELDYVPATTQLLSIPNVGGTVEETGLAVLRWYGLANAGLLDLTRAAQAVLALFKPGQTLTLSDGSALRWRENPGPFRGQARADAPGWAVITVTIPWRLYTTN
jgi:hypothetical protein